jgi:hypothetical protein
MKRLLTLIAFTILASAGSFAQSVNRYTIVAFHKLQPGKTIDDAIAIEKQWAPIHQIRKNAGVISDWIMYVPYNNIKSEGIDFDYITVNGGTDLDKLHTYPMELFADMAKADPSAFDKLAAATAKTQTILRQSISKRINGTAKGTNKSQFMIIDLMKVADGAAYEAFESKVLKVHEARIEAGNISGWSLYKTLYPSSNDVSINYWTIQSLDKLSKLDQMMDSYYKAIPKALGISAEEFMKQAIGKRIMTGTMLTTLALSTK